MFQCALSGKSLVRMRGASPLARKVVINKVLDRGESSQFCSSDALLAALKNAQAGRLQRAGRLTTRPKMQFLAAP
jgi:hypothetical protein